MEGVVPNVEELIRNLKHQVTLYRQLVDVIREERIHVIELKYKELRDSTYAKEAVIDEIQREEYRRFKWIKEAAPVFQLNPRDLTLDALAQIFAPTHFETLQTLKNTLSLMVKKTREMNSENRKLVEAALSDTQLMKKNILGLTNDKPQVYGPKGSMGATTESNARMLNQEA